MNKKRILISGASSLLMQHLMANFDLKEYEITGVSRQIQKGFDIQWLKGDISDTIFMRRAIAGKDIFIHAAGLTHSRNPQHYFDINYEATKQIVDISIKLGVYKFIFISTRTASPNNGAYSKSKWLAENYIKEHFPRWLIFQPSELFGGSKNEGIDQLIKNIITKKIIFYPAQVKSKLKPMHVKDAANMIHQYFERKNETIIINGPKAYSYKEFIRNVSQLTLQKKLLIPIPKIVIQIIKFIMEKFHLKTSIVPDQIPRLYGTKKSVDGISEMQITLKDHLEQITKK